MSPLTKLFVVLLVILSLLTTSATVVFVTKLEDLGKHVASAETKVQSLGSELTKAQVDLHDSQVREQAAISQGQAENEKSRQSVNQAQQRVNELSAQLATMSSDNAMKSADLTRVTEALKAAQDTNGKQSEQIAALRQVNDERLKQNVEMNTEVTRLTNELQVTERDRRYAVEQLTEAKRTVDNQRSMMQDAGVHVPKMAGAAIGAGAPPINGVIRNTSTIAGVPYASISVGSSDGVTKGMEFKVVDRNSGDFLGVLTVDSVEPTESTGRLTGPAINRIKAGTDVKTQL